MEHNFKKKFGQNFITDDNLLLAIVKDAKIGKNSVVIEVGAGAGTLTEKLAMVAKQVISFEIDEELKPKLLSLQKKYSNLKFEFCDFMKVDLKDYINEKEFHVVANLPYYITTAIISKFIETRPKSMTIMVQNEVADRICCEFGKSDYGALSVICQSVANIEKTRVVSKIMFEPQPKVDSAIVHFEFNDKNLSEDYIDFIHGCFSAKRKTLSNNLCVYLKVNKSEVNSFLNECGFKNDVRAEQLSVSDFEKLYLNLKNKGMIKQY